MIKTKTKKMNKKETEKGHCPKCGSKNIHYGVIEGLLYVQDDYCYYPINCNDCNHDAKECYSLEFIGHTEKLNQNKYKDETD